MRNETKTESQAERSEAKTRQAKSIYGKMKCKSQPAEGESNTISAALWKKNLD